MYSYTPQTLHYLFHLITNSGNVNIAKDILNMQMQYIIIMHVGYPKPEKIEDT